MAKIIDVRNDGGEFVVLGEAFVLPSSPILQTTAPLNGSLRYNNNLNRVEIAHNGSWGLYSSIPVVTEQFAETYTLTKPDANSVMQCNDVITITIPNDDTVPYPIGTFIEIHQEGAGVVTIAAGSGVTIKSRGSSLSTAGQDSVITLRKVHYNKWRIFGDLA